MPRKHRMYLPGIPSHVVQRGNDRNPCFFEEENYLFFLNCLEDACDRYDVAVHAYVLMTNHVHLLMTPRSKGSEVLGNESQLATQSKSTHSTYRVVSVR